ncbi:MAG: class I SAM-dependent methyltransferase [Acidobacteriota bacterium]
MSQTGTAHRPSHATDPWTGFYKQTPEYFRRLHEKALGEWRKPPPALDQIPDRGRLLDVGSGAGMLCVLAAVRGVEAIGLDISLEGARAGRDLARRRGAVSCRFVVGNANLLPFRDGAFDVVTHYTTLEHLDDPGASLEEVRRILMSGGRLLLFTVNALFPPRWNIALVHGMIRSWRMPLARKAAAFRRRGFRGPDEASWKAGRCLDTWRIPAPVLRGIARELLSEERYETFHLNRDGRLWLEENLQVRVERSSVLGRSLRSLYLLLNRILLIRHLGPVILWIGRRKNGCKVGIHA